MDTRKPVIRPTKHPYEELVEIVNEGVAYGWHRAHKYIDHPSTDLIRKAFKEIDTASYSTSSHEVIKLAKEQGLASDVTLSNALGFNGEDEIEQAKKDHAERIARIQEAQGGAEMAKPGARGVKDMSMDDDEAEDEREDATETTTSESTEKPVRGEGKDVE